MRKSILKTVAEIKKNLYTGEMKIIDEQCDADFLITQAKIELMSLQKVSLGGMPAETKRLALIKACSLLALALEKS